ncbi:hypothetical protein Pmar_PMAR018300 [Perkinsus marinus ATCC 50983]|uniref:Uncharacterized protein n=1 Tax=Perkinsus marinus (strain ATCC 50983 / TXsc) TaxID=423536 RepID=C5LVR0_PERM5|nr:hypothetical protein Pmar_PMAR018300 [Perkinsus marinus ATCC 50983]EEQ99183.1 hypothetical protein Pmar_PMAR018300 [Perkinsus marinus ATCC 50983]|eukprot:XP_002766466.1 hypothetical protein Pmar_PMAR018300 [Perkinsus marinus ATCC 50983]
MGFVVHLVHDDLHRTPLARRARCLRGSMLKWHQNRKELFGLAAHIFVDSLIPDFGGITQCDSHPASSPTLRQPSPGSAVEPESGCPTESGRVTCKPIERIAIPRLCDAIADVRKVWRMKYHVVPALLHVAASQNAKSDGLSRLTFSWGIPEKSYLKGEVWPGLARHSTWQRTPLTKSMESY